VFIAAIDGLSGFKDAIQSVFPKTQVQRCVIHQIRQSLKYVVWKDRKAFVADLKTVYQAATREKAEANLLQLEQTWGSKYGAAVRSWQNNWDDLATFFEFPKEIRRLIYTTNTVEGYHRQLRKVIKTKGSFPTEQSVRKLLYLATMNITRKWTCSGPIKLDTSLRGGTLQKRSPQWQADASSHRSLKLEWCWRCLQSTRAQLNSVESMGSKIQ